MSCRSSSEISNPGIAISPNPKILNWPGIPVRAGILSTIGTLCPVPPPVATSIITDFLKMNGDKNTQKMSKKNVQTNSNVPTFRLGNLMVRWMVKRSMIAIVFWRSQPKLSLLRKSRKLTARTAPALSATRSDMVWSCARPRASATLFGRVQPGLCRSCGRRAAIRGSRSTVVVLTAPVANRKRRTYMRYFIKKKRIVSIIEAHTTNCGPLVSSTASTSSSKWLFSSGLRRSSTLCQAPSMTMLTARTPTMNSLNKSQYACSTFQHVALMG
mmetsp:Transcript_9120/g.24213  ORF Transcript_9120/g.24213 Transcript_9120/m.24213 type:complete len:271 (+) Transcript_9120:300-1112(+)